MSINVTVTGNPVSIKRGQMLTTDPHTAKNEFEKRRLLRLEQVRQQSKELAENVRNKVRKEKKKQMGEIEKEGKQKLKNWQNRKLLELQNQYLNALDEMGMGHKQAETLADEDELYQTKKSQNAETAKTRGKLAETKLQVQKNQENYKKAMPIQHKKLVRDIENTRAMLVSSMKKPCRKNCRGNVDKPSADINITIPNDSDFSETSSSESSKCLPSIQEDANQDSEGFCECSSDESVEEKLKDDTQLAKSLPECSLNSKHQTDTSKSKSYKEMMDSHRRVIDNFKDRAREFQTDNRVSERIKRRQLVACQPDYCDLIAEPTPVPEVCESTRVRDKISSRSNIDQADAIPLRDPLELSSEECVCTRTHRCCCKPTTMEKSKSAAVQTDLVEKKSCKCGSANKFAEGKTFARVPVNKSRINGDASQQILSETSKNDKVSQAPSESIPAKPPIRLKDAGQMTSKGQTDPFQSQHMTTISQDSKVRHFDHPNRFERNLPSTSQVEKVQAESIEVIPNIVSEAEWYAKMRQRDMEAQARGKKALEKEKIQRDYENMMKKLPILQRREHISQIGTDKPEYHMSDERLKEKERQRQNQLENAYASAIPELRPKIVTLPIKRHDIPRTNEPFEILDGDDSRTLNLGKWDSDMKKKTTFTAEEVQEIIKAFTVQKPEDRKTKLKQLLRSLKLQKEQLLNEIKALPRDDSINALINDLTSFSDDDQGKRRSKNQKKKRHLEESDSSNTSTETPLKSHESNSRRKGKSGKSPHKKVKKNPTKVRVLQNMSTQTTPKATKEKSSTTSTNLSEVNAKISPEPTVVGLPKGIKICTKTHVPCDCFKKDVDQSEEVCKIYIKLNEEELPKVEVVTSAKESRESEEGGSLAKVGEKTEKTTKKSQEKSMRSPNKERRSKSPDKENIPPKTKSVATETDNVFKKPSPREAKRSKLEEPRKKPLSRARRESWKEQFSKNSMSTSSTSYMSPPDFSRQNTTGSSDPKLSMYNLRKKPQQTNFDRSSTLKTSYQSTLMNESGIDPKLLNYIRRLLGMSRHSVDDLGVSSSDIQTPSQSVIELESNNPMAAFHDVIKVINAKAAEIAQHTAGASSDNVNAPPNSSANLDGELRAEIPQGGSLPAFEKTPDTDRTKENLLSQYADMTDSCTKRIANLAAMIEQLRQEKIQMLESPPLAERPAVKKSLQPLTPPLSDKDNSTKYFEFPPAGEKSGTNSTASIDEEELNRRLLDIDMSLAHKLKKFKQTRGVGEKEEKEKETRLDAAPALPSTPDQLDTTNQEFLQRLQNLIRENNQPEELDEVEELLPPVSHQASFVPMLVNIPKLPILEPEPEGGIIECQEKRYPPPSKGLITAKKFNGNISLIPHELSTIIEADSQMSTKISPNNSNMITSPSKETPSLFVPPIDVPPSSPQSPKCAASEYVRIKTPSFSKADEKIEPTDLSESGKTLTCTQGTCTSLASTSSSSHPTSSSEDMKSIETMLKSIGMDWAIPTLHKTQEALALTSSSSTGELSSKRSGRSSEGSSEVSLKDFLKRQMISRISSSSLNKSDASPASFVRECSDISAIQANSSGERTRQRTSTPVFSSKSASKSKEDQQKQLFTGASELSSVKNSSCEDCCSKSSQKGTFQSLAGEESSATTIE